MTRKQISDRQAGKQHLQAVRHTCGKANRTDMKGQQTDRQTERQTNGTGTCQLSRRPHLGPQVQRQPGHPNDLNKAPGKQNHGTRHQTTLIPRLWLTTLAGG